MANRLVCLCNLVDENEIKAILKKGEHSTSDIQRITRAGTSCGRCLPEIDDLVAKHQKQQLKDPQKKMNFRL